MTREVRTRRNFLKITGLVAGVAALAACGAAPQPMLDEAAPRPMFGEASALPVTPANFEKMIQDNITLASTSTNMSPLTRNAILSSFETVKLEMEKIKKGDSTLFFRPYQFEEEAVTGAGVKETEDPNEITLYYSSTSTAPMRMRGEATAVYLAAWKINHRNKSVTSEEIAQRDRDADFYAGVYEWMVGRMSMQSDDVAAVYNNRIQQTVQEIGYYPPAIAAFFDRNNRTPADNLSILMRDTQSYYELVLRQKYYPSKENQTKINGLVNVWNSYPWTDDDRRIFNAMADEGVGSYGGWLSVNLEGGTDAFPPLP